MRQFRGNLIGPDDLSANAPAEPLSVRETVQRVLVAVAKASRSLDGSFYVLCEDPERVVPLGDRNHNDNDAAHDTKLLLDTYFSTEHVTCLDFERKAARESSPGSETWVQLASYARADRRPVAVCVLVFRHGDGTRLPASLVRLLKNPCRIKAGVALSGDSRALERDFGEQPAPSFAGVVELQAVFALACPAQDSVPGLCTILRAVGLEWFIDMASLEGRDKKRLQIMFGSERHEFHRQEAVVYATADVLATLLATREMSSALKSLCAN